MYSWTIHNSLYYCKLRQHNSEFIVSCGCNSGPCGFKQNYAKGTSAVVVVSVELRDCMNMDKGVAIKICRPGLTFDNVTKAAMDTCLASVWVKLSLRVSGTSFTWI